MPGKKRDAAVARVVEEEVEEAFPRGGGSGLAPIVHKQLTKDAYAEAEADMLGSGGKRSDKKRKKSKGGIDEGDEEDIFFSSLAAQDKLPKFVELLKFRTLTVGTKLWGAISEITPKELIINLPHGIKGHVSYQSASDVLSKLAPQGTTGAQVKSGKRKSDADDDGSATGPALAELFTVGQLVRCCISALRGGADNDDAPATGGKTGGKQRKRVELTLHVSKVNSGLGTDAVKEGAALPACVRSVEDHGYLLTFGIKKTSGFLPKKDAPTALKPGSLVEVVVQSVGAGGAAVVSAAPTAVASAVTREWEGLNIGSLLPGALVTARVRNVLSDGVIVSFLTFFTGTVDPFHLGITDSSKWRKQLAEDHRVKARILFIDPENKRVGLSLQPHLLNCTLPTENVPAQGEVFDAAEIRRIDPGLGLLLALNPTSSDAKSSPAMGFAHISNLSDDKVETVEGKFRVGQIVRARVIGDRPMDGISAVSLKPSVVDHSVMSAADLTVGMKLSGIVLRAEEHMVLLQITPHLRAVVPALHMSDVVSSKAHRKFKEGQKVSGKALGIDAGGRKVTVTLKPALVDSKLPALTSLKEATPGLRAHGVVTGVQDYGVFVSFFNDVSGLVPLDECGLPEGQKATDAYAPGQVVKCRVVGVDVKRSRLRLSLLSKKKAQDTVTAADPLGGIKPGTVLSGTVSNLHKNEAGDLTYAEVKLYDPSEGGSSSTVLATGRLEVPHLADHPAAGVALGEALKIGTSLDGLLVLQRLDNAKQLRVTRKASLVAAAAAGSLPETLTSLKEGEVVPGYVASVAGDGVFVRFLGELTGRAGLAQLSDTFVSDPHAIFSVGQSVRAQVAQVDSAKERFSLTLKQSLCGAQDGALLQSFFADVELAHRLSAEDEGGDVNFDYAAAFPIGHQVKGQVHSVKGYGLLCDLEAHSDVVGLAAPHQTPEDASTSEGSPVTAAVLDFSKKDGMVDLSLRPDLLTRAGEAAAAAAANIDSSAAVPATTTRSKKKAKKTTEPAAAVAAERHVCQVGEQMQATVELTKPEEGYCVVSLPEGHAPWIGFLSTSDFNLLAGAASASQQPQPGDVVTVIVAAAPQQATDRLILVLPKGSGAAATPGGGANGAAKEGDGGKKKKLPSGTVATAKIDSVHKLHADVTLDNGSRGRIFITEISDPDTPEATAPLSPLSPGSSIQVVVLGRMQSTEGKRHGLLELSCRPSVVATATAAEKPTQTSSLQWSGIKAGQPLNGYVQEVSGEYIWVVFSPAVRGRAFIPQAVSSLKECATAGKAFKPGQAVEAHVVAINSGKHALDVSFSKTGAAGASTTTTTSALKPGTTALGFITGVDGGGVQVQLGPGSIPRVPLTEIHDRAVANVLQGLHTGSFVKVAITGKDSKGQLEISLRPSKGGECSAHISASAAPSSEVPAPPETMDVGELKPGHRVRGYVKSSGTNGVFVCIARGVDARIRLRQLSDEFVENPAAAFPPGALVEGSVVSVEGGKVDLTLRRRRPVPSLESVEEGQVVRGRVKRIEKFGVFVELDDGGGACGLAHVSELADGFVEDVAGLFKVDQRVAARVLSVDKKAGRLSLGLKPSYLEGESDIEDEEPGKEAVDFDDELQGAMGASGSGSEEEGEEEDSDGGDGMSDDEPVSGFDLDEDLLDAEADEGGDGSEEEEDSEEESE